MYLKQLTGMNNIYLVKFIIDPRNEKQYQEGQNKTELDRDCKSALEVQEIFPRLFVEHD